MYTLAFPPTFAPKDFVEPGAQPSGDGAWFFVGYGRLDGGPVRCQVFRWAPGMAHATVVEIEHPTSGRGSLAIGGQGKALWLQSYEAGGRELIIQAVPGWTPPAWLR